MEAIAIVTLNALTIIVYLKERRLRKRNLYLVTNHAVADMLGASAISECWLLGSNCDFCTIHLFRDPFYSSSVIVVLWVVFPSGSLTNLAAISLERKHAKFCPFRHRLVRKKIFGAVIAAVWITAGLLATTSVLCEIHILTFKRKEDFFYLFFNYRCVVLF